MVALPETNPADPSDILRKLTALPHRGVGTEHAENAAALLKQTLEDIGARVESQPFLCPKTYLPFLWWLVGGILFGLLLAGYWPWPSFVAAAVFALMGVAHFDWRATPLPYLAPRVRAENIIAKYVAGTKGEDQKTKKIVLMAHYDSAPISFIYRSSLVSDFRRSLLISLALMLLAPVVILIEILGFWPAALAWLRYALAAYFVIQLILTSMDYFRYGFTNGAADNASGVAAAIATAERLWQTPVGGWEVELVLTSGEEVGMVGAREYIRKNWDILSKDGAYVLNFDNVGSGKIKIITETGSISPVHYDNLLVKAARRVAEENPRYADITTANWHTGDFDTIWFARAGIPSLTLSSQDENGLIAHLHRPEDTIENVDLGLPPHATDFAVAILESIRRQPPPAV